MVGASEAMSTTKGETPLAESGGFGTGAYGQYADVGVVVVMVVDCVGGVEVKIRKEYRG